MASFNAHALLAMDLNQLRLPTGEDESEATIMSFMCVASPLSPPAPPLRQ